MKENDFKFLAFNQDSGEMLAYSRSPTQAVLGNNSANNSASAETPSLSYKVQPCIFTDAGGIRSFVTILLVEWPPSSQIRGGRVGVFALRYLPPVQDPP